MKILVVTQYFWPENFKVNDLCDALIERGHDVTVYTGLPNYPEGTLFKGYSFFGPYSEIKDKIKIIRVPLVPRGKNKSILLALNYISFCFLSTILAPFLVRGDFDKIYVYQLSPVFSALPAVLLKYIKKAPIIMWVLDLWPHSLEATGVVKNKKILSMVGIFVKFIYHHTDKVFISSKGFEKKILEYNVLKQKIYFWPQWAEKVYLNAPSPDFYDERIPQLGFKVMFAGNIGSSQDFETIVSAAKILKDKKHIHFLILGDGLMKKWAEEEVQKSGLMSNFHFLGRKPVDLMPDYFNQADIMLMSLTDTELFSITVPSKLQSYLACKKPIIAALNGEGAEIVNDWQAGISVPASSPLQLAETIIAISQLSQDELSRMGENAFRCYQNLFEREKLISELEVEFSKLS